MATCRSPNGGRREDMSQNQVLLTPEEVADVLRIAPSDVMSLLEDGSLSGMLVAGHGRVRAQSVTDFLRDVFRWA